MTATLRGEKLARLGKRKGWCLLLPVRFGCFAIRFFLVTAGLDPVVHAERWTSMDCRVKPGNDERKNGQERIWNADRRSIQPAVLLARPRLQQEAHAYRRSTAALTCGLSPAARDFRPGFLGRGENADL